MVTETSYIHKHLFRMLHIDNLEKTLKEGMYAPNAKYDSDYINIGDEALIAQRSEFNVPIAPGGVLSDYVPFYFGGCSPMLLNIKTGYRGVRQRSQSEIVYICSHINLIINSCPDFCFTDGHAKDKLTSYYNNVADLSQIDWAVVANSFWKSTEDNPDRMRRKQAEFLVKRYVPVDCFSGIIVHDKAVRDRVMQIEDRIGTNLPVHIDINHNYYYND